MSDRRVVRFVRMKVKDLDAFKAVHAEALAAQAAYGVEEVVYQSEDDPRQLTLLISGTEDALRAWQNSPERAALAPRLELEGSAEVWEGRILPPWQGGS